MGILQDFAGVLRGPEKKAGTATNAADDAARKQLLRGVSSLRDILAPAGFRVNPKYLEIDGRFATTMFVLTYPRFLETNWFAPIVNFDVEFDAAMFVYPQESATILKQLRKRATQVSASISMEAEAGKIRDPQLETAFHDIEELRDRLVQGTERFFQFGLYLTLYGKTQEELEETVSQIEVLLEGRLVYAKPALFQMEQGFSSTLPLGHDELAVSTNMNSSPLSTSFPFVSSDLSSDSGILYGINLHNNSLVLFDRFSLENANLVIFAKSGAGKSVKGSEPVLMRQDGQVRLTPIKEVVENLISTHGITYTDEELEGVADPGIEVYSFNKEFKGEWSRVTVAARKDAPRKFYQFTTRSGREITTTGDHNMLVLRNGAVRVVKSTEVRAGEYIPLPRSIEPESKAPANNLNLLSVLKGCPRGIYVRGADGFVDLHYETLKKAGIDKKLDKYLYMYRQGRGIPLLYFFKMLAHLHLKPEDVNLFSLRVGARNGKSSDSISIDFPLTSGFFRLLGYIVAEGTIKQKLIILSNTDKELLRDAGATLKKLGVPFYYTDQALIIASRVFVNLLWTLGCKGKSEKKHVPSLVFASPNLHKSAFLTGYFEGDGGVENSLVSATSKSKALIGEISYLLYSFGIVGRIKGMRKEAVGRNWKRKRQYWRCVISGQENLRTFASLIGFCSPRKQQKLKQIMGKVANTNVDLVPEVSSLFQELYDLFGFQLSDIPEISAWKRGVRLPSRDHLKRVVEKIEARINHFKGLQKNFGVLEELPALDRVIAKGRESKELNRVLWKELGQSWRVAKTQRRDTCSQNAFKIIKAVNGTAHEITTVKRAVHCGLREMSIPIKCQPGHLNSALVARPKSNTAYNTIYRTAGVVCERYQQVRQNVLPRVEALTARLKGLASSELFWDEIAEVKELENKTDDYVYDLTVDNEVFLSGYGGMFVHNSYTVKLEILRSLMFGTEVIVIDPEQEYRYLAEAVGGSYLRIAIASDHRINPFDVPELLEDDNPEAVLRENITRLTGLISLMVEGLTPEERGLVDKALWETYAIKDITGQNRWEKPEVPTLQDFFTVMRDMEGGKSIATRLERFVEGTYAGVFNRPTNIDLDKQLIVFNVRDMEEELRPIAMYVILGFIWNRIRSSLKRRLLVVDEAWVLMQHEESASFLYSMAKRARKYYLGVTTITQDITDFIQSKYGKPIVTNSSLQLLLRQSPAAIDMLAEVFYLTDHEKFRLLESDVGEGIFFAGLKHVAIKIVASYAEDQIITSDPQQVLAIEAAKREMAAQQRTG